MKKFDGFMHGVNLGGWFSQCDYSDERYNNFITEKDFKVIADWGLDHIRLPIDYELVEDDDGKPLEKGYERIAKAIEWCKANNLNMILDLHKTLGYSFDPGHKESGFFENENLQERFYVLWENLARHFANAFEGSKNEICFELLNEVTDQSYCKKWNAIARTCIERIRKIAPTTKILVGGYWNNALAAVKDLDEPYDENIVYNFHCYEPLVFTHQGAHWIEKMPIHFRIPLKSTFAEYSKLTEEKCGQKGTLFNSFPQDATLDVSFFETIFDEAVKIAEERKVLLYCGEYGVIEKVSTEEAIEWYKLISTVFNKHGIGRAAWSYKEMDFGIADSRWNKERSELLKYL